MTDSSVAAALAYNTVQVDAGTKEEAKKSEIREVETVTSLIQEPLSNEYASNNFWRANVPVQVDIGYKTVKEAGNNSEVHEIVALPSQLEEPLANEFANNNFWRTTVDPSLSVEELAKDF